MPILDVRGLTHRPVDGPDTKYENREAYRRLARETEASLQNDVLDKWFPAAINANEGGFFENFAEDWSRGDARDRNLSHQARRTWWKWWQSRAKRGCERHIVYQARLTWLSAQASLHDPARAALYLAATRHGLAFLVEKLWDRQQGGFFWAVDVAGCPTTRFGGEKHAYGMAFGIFAAACSYQATRDPATLDLAKQAFHWLDNHAHDSRNGGYFEALAANGDPILTRTTRPTDAIGTRYGLKSNNTHIHLLEAFTSLCAVWPDAIARARLQELVEILRDTIYGDPGYLHIYLNADWTPVLGRDSFGHDIEAAYLLTEAAAALGQRDDMATWSAAQRLVDHALEFGFDREQGGFFHEGTPLGRDLVKKKAWWVQAEGLNTLLLMHERFGHETPRYWEAFLKLWEFISNKQIDHDHGGWYATVAPNGTAIAKQRKSDRWTDGYHQGRALLNVSAALHRLAVSTR